MTSSIRQAVESDVDSIISFDHIAQVDEKRKIFIWKSISTGNCFVVTVDHKIVGYAVLDYSFYDNGFISMLYIHPDFRNSGVGTALMQYLESTCSTPKLFTSTNLSNHQMQSLLAKLGYELSGFIDNLDEGDPELVYFKGVKESKG